MSSDLHRHILSRNLAGICDFGYRENVALAAPDRIRLQKAGYVCKDDALPSGATVVSSPAIAKGLQTSSGRPVHVPL